MESTPALARARGTLAPRTLHDVGSILYLRSELQHLIRLPHSGAILFLLGDRLLRLDRVTLVPERTRHLTQYIETMPDDILRYKGITTYGNRLLVYLSAAPGGGTRNA